MDIFIYSRSIFAPATDTPSSPSHSSRLGVKRLFFPFSFVSCEANMPPPLSVSTSVFRAFVFRIASSCRALAATIERRSYLAVDVRSRLDRVRHPSRPLHAVVSGHVRYTSLAIVVYTPYRVSVISTRRKSTCVRGSRRFYTGRDLSVSVDKSLAVSVVRSCTCQHLLVRLFLYNYRYSRMVVDLLTFSFLYSGTQREKVSRFLL